jgi:hypothetical protein
LDLNGVELFDFFILILILVLVLPDASVAHVLEMFLPLFAGNEIIENLVSVLSLVAKCSNLQESKLVSCIIQSLRNISVAGTFSYFLFTYLAFSYFLLTYLVLSYFFLLTNDLRVYLLYFFTMLLEFTFILSDYFLFLIC